MNGSADVERVGVATSDAARRSLAWLAGFALGWELATATAGMSPACPAGANQPAGANPPAGANRVGAV